jgi:hypothetical protein
MGVNAVDSGLEPVILLIDDLMIPVLLAWSWCGGRRSILYAFTAQSHKHRSSLENLFYPRTDVNLTHSRPPC